MDIYIYNHPKDILHHYIITILHVYDTIRYYTFNMDDLCTYFNRYESMYLGKLQLPHCDLTGIMVNIVCPEISMVF